VVRRLVAHPVDVRHDEVDAAVGAAMLARSEGFGGFR
jgi:hypothetical protein